MRIPHNHQHPLLSKLQKLSIISVCLMLLSSCALFKARPPGFGPALDWNDIDGWDQDNHAQIWPAIQSNCKAVSKRPDWKEICAAVPLLNQPDDKSVKQFFENWFVPHQLYGQSKKQQGLITGYYEPLLFGSRTPDQRYRYPIYQQPASLLTIELGELYPSLKNKRIRGLKKGNKIIPFYSREQIEANRELLSGNELLWIDDRDALFFLHIQGSGRVQLNEGKTVGVGYSNQNGHPYVAIGRILLEQGELEREKISLFTIRQWLQDNPAQAEDLLNKNPSYVFFELREQPEQGPVGSLNVPLTPERSLAIDPKLVDLGTPIWLSTNFPGELGKSYQRLVIAQDTGGAIKGPLRADLFWGFGEYAERAAGVMKEYGEMIVLLPTSMDYTE